MTNIVISDVRFDVYCNMPIMTYKNLSQLEVAIHFSTDLDDK